MDPASHNKNREIVAALAVFIVIVAIVAATSVANKPQNSSGDIVKTSTTDNQPAVPSNATYKDGQYTASASYEAPGETESITISVTLTANIITGTSAKSGSNSPVSSLYQQQFIAGYKQQIVGKNINSVKLSRISGSSLTSQGFNEALTQIKKQAQAG